MEPLTTTLCPNHKTPTPPKYSLPFLLHFQKIHSQIQIMNLFHFHFIIIFTQLFFHAYSLTHWEDIQSLKQFRNGVVSQSISPGSCLSSWDFTFDPCDSLSTDKFTCGIRCDLAMSGIARITEITLDQAGYSGSLNSCTWNLPYLQILDLTNNYFTGPIPNSFSRLTRLSRLSVSTNSLTGSIPDSVPDSLEELLLDNNNLTGPIPQTLNKLKKLIRLELQQNQLSGEFPELTQLGALNFLDVSNNHISGYLPTTFPVNLIELTMRNNSLQGNIPASLVTGSVYLQVLDLSYNNLTGSLPPELFTHPSLQQLTLSHNQLQRVQIPANWGRNNINNSELIAVDLSNNNINGVLPGFMGWMPKLSALSLENNKFSGVIPTQYAVKAVTEGELGVGPFERLLLGGNYLFGLIPGPLLQLKSGSGVTIRLGDNCLYECPESFYFCGGGVQKSLMECKTFTPVIP